MRSHRPIVFVAALAVAGYASAQEWRGGKARVEGTVKSEKGEPIEGAKVSLRWGQSSHGGPDLTTDKKGHWAFFGLNGGPWDVDFEAAGFQPKKISIQLQEGGRNPPVDVQLAAKAPAEASSAHEEVRVGGKTISKEASEAIERANAAFQARNFSEARENYLKALGELPDNEPLLMRIAAAYEGEGNRAEALKYARTSVEKDAEDINAWLLIATIELQDGNLEEGKAALAKVPPEKVDPEAYMNMGIVLYNKKKSAEAEVAFAQALARKPDLADGYYYRGLARLQQRNKQGAKEDFEKYLQLAPNGPDAKDVKELLTTLQ